MSIDLIEYRDGSRADNRLPRSTNPRGEGCSLSGPFAAWVLGCLHVLSPSID